jgi:hypothetical protein
MNSYLDLILRIEIGKSIFAANERISKTDCYKSNLDWTIFPMEYQRKNIKSIINFFRLRKVTTNKIHKKTLSTMKIGRIIIFALITLILLAVNGMEAKILRSEIESGCRASGVSTSKPKECCNGAYFYQNE